MSWRTIGTVEYRGYVRRVAWNPKTGEVERTSGNERIIVRDKTSRHIGRASTEDEAKRMALADLVNSFERKT